MLYIVNNKYELFLPFPLHFETGVTQESNYSGPVLAVIVCVAILSVLLAAMGAYFTWNIRHKLPLLQ